MEIKNFSPLIHIGFPKTATTFLQKNIFSNSDYNFIPITDSIVRNNKKLYESRFKIKGFAGYFLTENNGGRFPKQRTFVFSTATDLSFHSALRRPNIVGSTQKILAFSNSFFAKGRRISRNSILLSGKSSNMAINKVNPPP